MKHTSTGFTLIEVVAVLVLIGILAATAVSKFTGSATFEAYTFRTSLISALRLTQQRAMQQTDTSTGYCHQIIIENKRYGVPDRTNCSVTSFPNPFIPDYTGMDLTDSRYEVTFAIDGGGSAISFDSMGRPKSDCSGGCTLSISSTVETLKIKIESEGYIHASL